MNLARQIRDDRFRSRVLHPRRGTSLSRARHRNRAQRKAIVRRQSLVPPRSVLTRSRAPLLSRGLHPSLGPLLSRARHRNRAPLLKQDLLRNVQLRRSVQRQGPSSKRSRALKSLTVGNFQS